VVLFPGSVDGAEEDSAEEDAEDGQVGVLLSEEGLGTLNEISY
jgi:hypothetical protein